MAVFQKLTMAETAARLQSGVDTWVVFHRHPDGDAVGSGFALRLLLEAMDCPTVCLCEDEVPARLQFLGEEIQATVRCADLAELPAPAQIITVDTASPSQLGTLYEPLAGRINLMIDHHGKGEMYADGWVSGDYAAAGQMVFELSRELCRTGRLAGIPVGVDRLLYAALSSDTGCFRYSNATPEAHMTAAELLRAGFNAADLNHRLFGIKSRELLLAERVGFDRLRLFAGGRIGIVDMPADVRMSYGLGEEHLGTLVDIPRSLEGVEIAVAVRQVQDTSEYRVSMRSSSDADVSAVCATFGGGGHAKAAGCGIISEAGSEAVVQTVANALCDSLGWSL